MTRADYLRALREVIELCAIDPPADSEAARHLDKLAAELESYERAHIHFAKPSPEELEAFRREQQEAAPNE